MMTGVGFILVTVFFLMLFAGFAWLVTSVLDGFDKDFHTDRMARWNPFKWIICGTRKSWELLVYVATWKPKTGIDKEIADEEKEIEELERQKEKIDTLAELKRRKERLFDEVQNREHSGLTKEEEEYYFGDRGA